MKNTQKIVTKKLTDLIGLNIKGVKAQVRNPIYINPEMPPCWRTLSRLKQYKEKGKEWIELYWERAGDDSCKFTGCTVESNSCAIQFEKSVWENLKSI